jgi:asparagine synthase (glutamine-hydrolysing)
MLAPVFRRAPHHFRYSNLGDKLHKLAEVLPLPDADTIYRQGLISHWKDPSSVVVGGREPGTLVTERWRWPLIRDFTERMMWLDLVSYLPDDILVKVDRAAMAVSLETRAPFLDHRIVEFAWRLPLSMKIRDSQGKWLLRQILHRYVPRELVERPKMGFGVPLDGWLRGPLKEWAWNLLAPERVRREGLFYPEPIMAKWREHQSGRRNWAYDLWNVLMFQAWRESVGSQQLRSRDCAVV